MRARSSWVPVGGVVAISICLAVALPAAAQDTPPAGGGSAAGASPAASIPGALPIPSGGQGTPTPPLGSPSGAPAKSGVSGRVSGGVLVEKISEDYFLTLDLYNELAIGPLSFGVWVPLRFRVLDRDPQNHSIMRQEDWDEVSDYAKLLRFVELNLVREKWRLRARFGALDGESLGHGTVIAGYYNSIDRDHYQAGIVLNTAIKYGGVELLLDNLLAPEIFGVRVHVRPASFFTSNVWANKLAIGVGYYADAHAPVALVADTARVPPPPTPAPAVDGKNNLLVDRRAVVGVIGLDAEYALLQNKLLDLVPYVDVNIMHGAGGGVGMHLGTFFNVRIPTPVGPTLLTRLEYRLVGSGYAPRYVDSLYEAQRVQYDPALLDPTTKLPLTKLGWLRGGGTGLNGWLGELYFDFAGWIRVGGTFEDYQGPNNSALTLSLLLPKLEIVQLGAFYSKRGFDSMRQAFDLDGALLLAFARVKVYGPLYVSASYSRTWHVQPDGSYQTDDNFSAGAGVAFSY